MKCTIVLLTYNGELYIDEMLNSIKNQTYRPIQLIISDDASTDGTIHKIRSFIKENHDEQLTIEFVEHTQNCGRVRNRNGIIHLIQGEYIFMADQDDIWESSKLEKQIDFLKNHEECVGVSCDRKIMDEKGTIIIDSEDKYVKRQKKHVEILGLDDGNIMSGNYPANCIGCRNTDIDRLFLIPEEIEEPDRFFRVMLLCKGKIGFINEGLVRYRIHSENLSGNYYVQYHSNLKKIFQKYVKENKRYNRIYQKDDEIIVEEAYTRFGITLEKKYAKRKKRKAYINAAVHIVYDLLNGNVGCFRN